MRVVGVALIFGSTLVAVVLGQAQFCAGSDAQCEEFCELCDGMSMSTYTETNDTKTCTCDGEARSQQWNEFCTRSCTIDREFEGVGCFPSDGLVTRSDGSVVRIADVRIGDRVVVGPGGETEEVFFFAVRAPSPQSSMIRLHLSTGRSVTASNTHLVYLRGNHTDDMKFSRMENIREGDVLVSCDSEEEGEVRVLMVEREVATQGLYGPVTASSRLVVGGVLFSVYAGIGPDWRWDAFLPFVWFPLKASVFWAFRLAGGELTEQVSEAVWGNGVGGYWYFSNGINGLFGLAGWLRWGGWKGWLRRCGMSLVSPLVSLQSMVGGLKFLPSSWRHWGSERGNSKRIGTEL
uniref:Hint domain-containing protein n=1 Tax=Chromera velia CCMP2878 TaxID=1169474 RepID=A0A0G4IBV7_9ALVE|eukprot:Cvel_12947.t1-p1 / transcript=Cvel_12947.t1 / gene=Cvel_12947 / organism=Chromera_velia_CCMP2878 / gene_product=hypothetical protein / transcript_product=hypothetical protein / location=Cvel_scaffold866:38013-39053(+) / protein_length=347 / sequence_SO=supercontig / SO=protein_coding / is_pseudo=false